MKELFIATNVLIALDYFLIGVYFLRRTPLLRRSPRRSKARAMIACYAAGLFFFGCMHTHILLALTESHMHWHSWFNVVSHILQGVGGLTFWYLARHHLVLNIFDKILYERATDDEAEARLQYLADRVGLVRR